MNKDNKMKIEEIKAGMIAGRHDLPVDKYIFNDVKNVFNFKAIRIHINKFIESNFKYKNSFKHLIVYVTGLTTITAEIVMICAKREIALTLMHYNRETGKYIPQYMPIYINFDKYIKND